MTGAGRGARFTEAVEPAPLDGGLWVSTSFISYVGNKCMKKKNKQVFFSPYPNKRTNMYLMSTRLWHFLLVRRLVVLPAHSSQFAAAGE